MALLLYSALALACPGNISMRIEEHKRIALPTSSPPSLRTGGNELSTRILHTPPTQTLHYAKGKGHSQPS